MSATALNFRKALATNSTADSFTGKTPTATKPSGAGVIDLLAPSTALAQGENAPSYMQLVPFGSDANNETFDMRLFAWNREVSTGLWIPTLLLELNVTLGNIAATGFGADHFLADTIVVAKGTDNGGFQNLISPANDTPASLLVHLRGAELVEFAFDLTGAAASNCLYRTVD